ncbi:hypothetical protein GCM10010106_19200 [Thermopolyspora flexuosa]|jgi:hypothetical protein|uniref:Uncharacterized protein n=1 Tax=Thermopolyspora flexuosa TaxID=103836 RepID=A0A543J3U3_9ACTN|nr:hypothetical protein FHX40_4259 [Thermopolyspora flexuosa]GGM72952.1 hypothetical protein GCM10010106_19200 [Thermopolyspora flexuosa]
MFQVLSALIPPGVVAAVVIYAVVKLVRAEGPAATRERDRAANSREASGS